MTEVVRIVGAILIFLINLLVLGLVPEGRKPTTAPPSGSNHRRPGDRP